MQWRFKASEVAWAPAGSSRALAGAAKADVNLIYSLEALMLPYREGKLVHTHGKLSLHSSTGCKLERA